MFCRNCGKQLSDTAKFCSGCGKPVVRNTPEQQSAQPVKIQPEVRPQPVITEVPKTEKKKAGGVIIVIEIIVVLILLLAIGIGIFFLFKDKIDLSKFKKADSEVTAEVAPETEMQDTHFEDALAEGDFEGVISEIVDMDEEDFKADEDVLKDVLSRAISGHLDAALIDVDEKVASDDYIAALTALDEENEYRMELAQNSVASEFTEDSSAIEAKRESVLSDYQDAVFAQAESKGNQGSTEDVQAIFRESDQYLSGDDYENGKTKVYTRLVLAKLGNMQLNQEDAAVALQYIDANLNLVRNDCWVLEFWDYFNALDEMQRGGSYAGEVTHRNDEGYLLPDSDSRELTEEDLDGFSKIECRLARYEIYARHGRGFSDASVTNYFHNFDWYHEEISYQDFDEFSLSEIEMENRDLIIKYEKEQGYR